MADRMGVDGSETQHLMAINRLMEKLEQLNIDLASMVAEVRLTNPIVGNVLDNAKKVMVLITTTANGNDDEKQGMPKCDEDYNNKEGGADDVGDFVE